MLQTPGPIPFYVFNASAGSGKTFTIVKKYLSLLFQSSQKDFYKNILAITFTNKAVAEMKSRIIEALRAFAEEDTPAKYVALRVAIEEETQLTAEEVHQKSKLILESILHNYAAFEISTIDGFTHRVLRTFAKDLGIAINFEVEMDTGLVLSEAVDRIIEKAGKDQQLTKILIDFSLSKADDDKSWDIAKDLNEIAKLLINENYIEPLGILQKYELKDFKTFEKLLQE
ncbi:MAG: UvrD-helicase domain-containing protein, partial [Mesonia sp.]